MHTLGWLVLNPYMVNTHYSPLFTQLKIPLLKTFQGLPTAFTEEVCNIPLHILQWSFFFKIKCIGMILVNNIIWVSSIQICNTLPICCIVCSPPSLASFCHLVFGDTFSLLVLPAFFFPSGNHYTVICVYEFIYFVCSLVIFYPTWVKLLLNSRWGPAASRYPPGKIPDAKVWLYKGKESLFKSFTILE